jgi:DNA-binding IclR family transcriptional regulator
MREASLQVLESLAATSTATPAEIVARTGLTLGQVCGSASALRGMGLTARAGDGWAITEAGRSAMWRPSKAQVFS